MTSFGPYIFPKNAKLAPNFLAQFRELILSCNQKENINTEVANGILFMLSQCFDIGVMNPVIQYALLHIALM